MTATLTYAPARFEAVPEFSETMGDECIAFARAAGLVLDEWQCDVIRAALGTDPFGRWAAMEVALIVPRQNGKGSVLEALELYHLFMVPTTRLITHTAHRFDTCLDHFRRIRSLIENTPQLLALVKDNGRGVGDTPSGIKDSNGKESVELVDGCRLIFKTRDKGSGAGFSGDLVIIDEAWYIRDLSGLIPTMAARENPQVWYTSSAPHPRVESDSLRSLIRQGRSLATDPDYHRPEPEDPTMAYFEWSVDLADIDDLESERVIQTGNPAYGIRINRRFCRLERQRMGDEMYLRERHGVFPDGDDAPQWMVVAERVWRHKAAAENPPDEGWLTGTVSLAVERSEIGTAAPLPWSVCVAGDTHDGHTGIDVLGRFEDDRKVIELLVAATHDDAHPVSHVVIDLASPAAAIVEPLRAAGVEVNTDITARLLAATTTRLIDELTDGRTVHRSNPDLDAAVSVARLRKFGESKVIDRWTGHDSTPFIGCDLAVWGHQNQPAPAPPGFAMILGGP